MATTGKIKNLLFLYEPTYRKVALQGKLEWYRRFSIYRSTRIQDHCLNNEKLTQYLDHGLIKIIPRQELDCDSNTSTNIYNFTFNRNICNELVFKYGNLKWVNIKKTNLIFYFTIHIFKIKSKTCTQTAKLFSFLRPSSHLQDHGLLFGTNFLSPKRVFLTYKTRS